MIWMPMVRTRKLVQNGIITIARRIPRNLMGAFTAIQ